jgi:hypothetical protein
LRASFFGLKKSAAPGVDEILRHSFGTQAIYTTVATKVLHKVTRVMPTAAT